MFEFFLFFVLFFVFIFVSYCDAKLGRKYKEYDDTVLDQAYDLLTRLRRWDHLDYAADGPYWKSEIDKTIARIESETDV